MICNRMIIYYDLIERSSLYTDDIFHTSKCKIYRNVRACVDNDSIRICVNNYHFSCFYLTFTILQ